MSMETPPPAPGQGVRFLETRNAFGEALLELAAKDRDIVALTGGSAAARHA
jgi:transketolase C-terminal domain/subunit